MTIWRCAVGTWRREQWLIALVVPLCRTLSLAPHTRPLYSSTVTTPRISLASILFIRVSCNDWSSSRCVIIEELSNRPKAHPKSTYIIKMQSNCSVNSDWTFYCISDMFSYISLCWLASPGQLQNIDFFFFIYSFPCKLLYANFIQGDMDGKKTTFQACCCVFGFPKSI